MAVCMSTRFHKKLLTIISFAPVTFSGPTKSDALFLVVYFIFSLLFLTVCLSVTAK